uniref:Uncharacterized protein n=1 Tax=Arundo donax TaxID=35708 RepID=A0A0A8Y124_ARUDO
MLSLNSILPSQTCLNMKWRQRSDLRPCYHLCPSACHQFRSPSSRVRKCLMRLPILLV